MRKIVHRAECDSVGPHDNQRSESKQWTLVILSAYKLVIQSASQWTKIKNSILELFGKTKANQINYRISSYKTHRYYLLGLQLQVLLEITKFHRHKSVPGVGIIKYVGIIRKSALYEEIWYIGWP